MPDELDLTVAERLMGGHLEPYSTSIAAAMEVLNKSDGMWELSRYPEGGNTRFSCQLRFGDSIGYQSGCATAPEAICYAALQATASASALSQNVG